ncbi:MAG: recombinase family protein [Brachybacterium sp.]|uniref:recombinase family protein n=1 Tax=Brachybacterium sp. TaxID=1891286 RepID=UPI0026494A7B|nr:recombinase family protein [Brachybacterium sp.]MDN5687277.1 recombinase family protein [Brachybacterium sp.]
MTAATAKRPLRVGIYCRISLDKRGDELGVQRQLDEARSIAEARGWMVVAEYIDNSKSAFAKNVRRPKYEEMVAAAKSGEIDGVIVWDLDRLTRQPRQLEDWCDMGETRGFTLVTVDGSHDLSTENGRMFARIKASVARQESEHKAKRQKFSNAQRAKMGRPPHTGRAFGYNLDGTVREDEAELVREMFSRFAAGSGLHTIARWLGEQGVVNTRGKPWGRVGVRDLLLNPRYIAQRWVLRTQSNGTRRREYVGPGNWTPLVSEDVFRAVGDVLADPARRDKYGQKGNARLYLGAGLFLCGTCEQPMRTGYSGNQSGHPYRTYVCPKWHVVRKASYVEAIVEGAMCERLRDPNIISAMASESGAAGEVQRLRDEANGLRGRLDQITKDYAAGDLTARQLNVATEATEEKLSVVEHRLARIGSSNALMGLMGSADPGAAWMSLDVNAQATVVKALADVFIHKQALGRRPSSANREKHKQWQENLIKSIEVRWHKEPQPLIT